MNKFKAGDKVRRINDSWANCFVGEIYYVDWVEGCKVGVSGHGYSYDIENFELVEEPEDLSKVFYIKSEREIGTAWLDKLAYVLRKDGSVADTLALTDTSEVVLFSDMSAIVGSADIYQYVENTYDQLKSQEIQKKSQKLLEQKEQLAKQLADIEKELESLK